MNVFHTYKNITILYVKCGSYHRTTARSAVSSAGDYPNMRGRIYPYVEGRIYPYMEGRIFSITTVTPTPGAVRSKAKSLACWGRGFESR